MSYSEWGTITWKFFHTFAEKINESKFSEYKEPIINIILEICDNLPCPICKGDAAEILKYAYIKNIKTKKHLIELLRQFHNIVNIKLGKKNFSIEEVNNMYKNNNLQEVLNNFLQIYRKRTFNLKLLNNTQYKIAFLNSLLIKIKIIRPAINP